MNNRFKKVIALLLATIMMFGCTITVDAASDVNHPIMGSNSVTIGQMINFYTRYAAYPSYYSGTDAPTIYDFCRIYYEECQAEGVDVLVAFAQCMHETGYLRYTGDVDIEQHNFAGIGATGGGAKGRSFASVRLGVRAQVQRLKAYATPGITRSDFANPIADPVGFTDWYFANVFGKCPTVYLLSSENNGGYGWAPSSLYPVHILSYMNKIENESSYTTWYDGVNYSAVYDPYYYADNNTDVKKAFGNDGDALIAHFIKYGMEEGRKSSPYFDVKSYKRQYRDLRQAYGNDTKSYYLHYAKYGYSEGRAGTGCTKLINGVTVYNGVDYSAVYDYNYYQDNNRDIAKAFGEDDLATLKHFVEYGMKEGRKSKASFDVTSYRNQYADLRRAYGNDTKGYYMHYLNYGQSEGRQTTGCTSLINANTSYEGYSYSDVYDYNYYISRNKDVVNALGYDENLVLQHFIEYGMSEGRIASTSFNVIAYKESYGDLRAAYGDDLKSYYLHYIKYGKAEGRIAV